jgi:NAD(P)-dependent dehydrogenase (short-subunit alcohol dehydrogenase family)
VPEVQPHHRQTGTEPDIPAIGAEFVAEYGLGVGTMILDQFRLDGKIALVTGASRGIGRAIAVGLAQAGADVALASRTATALENVAAEVRALGRRALVLPVDVADLAEIRGMVDATVAEYGGIDVLVNGAGVPGRKPTVELTEADFDHLYDVNIKGVTFCCVAAGPHLLARRGSIINICSLTTTIGLPGRALYGPSKGAVGQLTKSLAVEWGPAGVRVNAIAPGWIETDLSRAALQNPAFSAKVLERTPIGRIGQPADIAGAAVFLTSPAASFITGHILTVDGGYLAS